MADDLSYDESGYLDMDRFDDVDPDSLADLGIDVSSAIDSLAEPPLADEAWDAMLDHAVDADAPPAPLDLLGHAGDPAVGDAHSGQADEALLDLGAGDVDDDAVDADWADDPVSVDDAPDDDLAADWGDAPADFDDGLDTD